METGSVMAVPASNSVHPLNDTLQKALEALKSHQQWISNRANSATVSPEQQDDVRSPKRDLWMMQDEDLVDKTTTRFPVRKSKLGGFKTAAIGSKKILPTSAVKPMQDNEEMNKPIHPPKAAITAWDEPNPMSKETELITVDLEDTTVSTGTNNPGFEMAAIRRKEQESITTVDTTAMHTINGTAGGDNDEAEQISTHSEVNSEGPNTTGEQLAEAATAKEITAPPLHDKNISVASVDTPSPPVTVPLSEAQDHSVSDFDGSILAVSPAPVSQQLSLSSVTQSKLRMSELEAFRLENNTAISAGLRRGDATDGVVEFSVQHNRGLDGNKKDVTVADPVLHVVTPQQRNETSGQAAVFTLPKKSTVVSSIATSAQTSEEKEVVKEDATMASVSESSRKETHNAAADSSTLSVANALDLPELKGVENFLNP